MRFHNNNKRVIVIKCHLSKADIIFSQCNIKQQWLEIDSYWCSVINFCSRTLKLIFLKLDFKDIWIYLGNWSMRILDSVSLITNNQIRSGVHELTLYIWETNSMKWRTKLTIMILLLITTWQKIIGCCVPDNIFLSALFSLSSCLGSSLDLFLLGFRLANCLYSSYPIKRTPGEKEYDL